VALHFVSETFDYDDDEAALVRYVKGYSSKKEREKIRERTLRGKYTRALQGKVHNAGSELYGYRRDRERGVRVIYEPEAAIVRLIFEWVARDRLPLRSVAQRLEKRGVPPPSNGKYSYRDPERLPARWSRTQIRDMLNNPAYKGEAVEWRWRQKGGKVSTCTLRPESEWVKLPDGVVPAIVSPALWADAHDALTVHSGETTRNERRPYLLRGHIFCAVCGKRMHPMCESASRTHPQRVYRCGSRDTAAGACGGKRVPAEAVEAWAWGKITFTIKRPDVLAAEIARREAEGPDATLTDDLEKAKRGAARCERDQRKLVAKLHSADDEREGTATGRLWKLVEEEIDALEGERAGWLKTIEDIEGRLAAKRLQDEQLVALYDACARIGANLDHATFEDQRLAVAALAVRVDGNGMVWAIDGRIALDIPDRVLSSETRSSG
jgi:site-specific DNA recombinase